MDRLQIAQEISWLYWARASSAQEIAAAQANFDADRVLDLTHEAHRLWQRLITLERKFNA